MLTVVAKLTGWGALEICSSLPPPPATPGFFTRLLGLPSQTLMLAGHVFLPSELAPSSSEGRFLTLVSMSASINALPSLERCKIKVDTGDTKQ